MLPLLFFFVKKKENNIKLKLYFGISREKIVATRFGLQSVSLIIFIIS